MIKLVHLYVTIFLFPVFLNGQNLPMVWPFGYGNNLNSGFGISYLDFLNGKVEIYPVSGVDKFSMGVESSFVADSNGMPLLMTNNCQVRNSDFEIIEKGDTISPGPIYFSHCQEIGYYPLNRASLFLPGVGGDDVQYLVTRSDYPSIVYQTVVSDRLYLSKIKKKTGNKFELISREILSDTLSNPANLIATLDFKLNGWWVYNQKFNTNEFHFYHIGPDTTIGPVISVEGPTLLSDDISLGQIAFSANGDLLAIPTKSKGLHLYGFDNSSGKVSGHQEIVLPDNDRASGVCFSPSGRFLYVSTVEKLYQIDLLDGNEIFFLGEMWEPGPTGWPVGIGDIYAGPDCRLYIAPSTTSKGIHLVHNPDKKGVDCNFELMAIISPTRLLLSFPNMPRLDAITPCDSSIEWGFVSGVQNFNTEEECKVFPNPFSKELTIQTSFSDDLVVKVYNAFGQHQLTKEFFVNQKISFSELQPGIYFFKVFASGKLVSVEKVVKSN